MDETSTKFVSPFRQIINTVPAGDDRTMVSLSAQREMNQVPGTRPSHAARSAVNEYNANPERFRQRFNEIRRLERS